MANEKECSSEQHTHTSSQRRSKEEKKTDGRKLSSSPTLKKTICFFQHEINKIA